MCSGSIFCPHLIWSAFKSVWFYFLEINCKVSTSSHSLSKRNASRQLRFCTSSRWRWFKILICIQKLFYRAIVRFIGHLEAANYCLNILSLRSVITESFMWRAAFFIAWKWTFFWLDKLYNDLSSATSDLFLRRSIIRTELKFPFMIFNLFNNTSGAFDLSFVLKLFARFSCKWFGV